MKTCVSVKQFLLEKIKQRKSSLRYFHNRYIPEKLSTGNMSENLRV
jgi:hypothetical protein